MPKLCVVPGCETGRHKHRKKIAMTGGRQLGVFLLPKDIELSEKWKEVIPVKNLNHRSGICELHFADECIERHFVTKLPDGTVVKMDRGRTTLKPGSIPSIFSTASPNILPQEMKRKPLKPFEPGSAKLSRLEIIPNEKLITNKPTKVYGGKVKYGPTKEFKYSNLVSDLKKVAAPSSWWTVSATTKYVICVKWDLAFRNIWKVIVCEDLKVKIFLESNETASPNMQPERIKNVMDLSQLLFRLEKVSELRQEIEKTKVQYIKEEPLDALDNDHHKKRLAQQKFI